MPYILLIPLIILGILWLCIFTELIRFVPKVPDETFKVLGNFKDALRDCECRRKEEKS